MMAVCRIKIRQSHCSLVSIIILGLLSAPLSGQGQYEIPWHTIEGGGGRSTGGQYVLTGTIGQHDAGYSAAGRYEFMGGYLPSGPSCMVQFSDFARLAEQWLRTGEELEADIDQDNDVDIADLSWLADFWLCRCPVPWSLK